MSLRSCWKAILQHHWLWNLYKCELLTAKRSSLQHLYFVSSEPLCNVLFVPLLLLVLGWLLLMFLQYLHLLLLWWGLLSEYIWELKLLICLQFTKQSASRRACHVIGHNWNMTNFRMYNNQSWLFVHFYYFPLSQNVHMENIPNEHKLSFWHSQAQFWNHTVHPSSLYLKGKQYIFSETSFHNAESCSWARLHELRNRKGVCDLELVLSAHLRPPRCISSQDSSLYHILSFWKRTKDE